MCPTEVCTYPDLQSTYTVNDTVKYQERHGMALLVSKNAWWIERPGGLGMKHSVDVLTKYTPWVQSYTHRHTDTQRYTIIHSICYVDM